MDLGDRSAVIDSIRGAEAALFEVVGAAARAAGSEADVVSLHQLAHHHAWRAAQWSQLAPLLAGSAGTPPATTPVATTGVSAIVATVEPPSVDPMPEALDLAECVKRFHREPTAVGWHRTIGATSAHWYRNESLRCEATLEGDGENGPYRRTLGRTVADLEADLAVADPLTE